MKKSGFPWELPTYARQLAAGVRFLKRAFGSAPELGIIFGSGLGGEFLRRVRVDRELDYRKVPHFSSPTVRGHEGKILKVEAKSGRRRQAAVLQGRYHYYEGYAPEQVVFPLRVLSLWGVERFVITNASGALSPRLHPGDLAWIRDHLNFTGANPLRGPNLEILGPRFPSLAHAYQNRFSKQVLKSAARIGLSLKSGIYVGISGPSYETEAEIRAFRKLGGDMVGMSTVFEVIAAAHAEKELIALSAISNSCLHPKRPVNHEEVLRNAKQVDGKLAQLLVEILR